MMDLEHRVLKTLELFALQQTALTVLEAWKFLVRDVAELKQSISAQGELMELPELENRIASVSEVLSTLQVLVTSGAVVSHFGYYTLARNQELLEKRWLGYQYGVWREKRIRRFVYFLRFIPFVRGVALAGSQALGLQKKESDIDLLVITAPYWLWLPRTLITGYFQVFGVRRHGTSIANRFCLNHYLCGPKQMHTGRNWYTALEYGKLRPLVGEGSISEFQEHNSQWLTAFFPNFFLANTDVKKSPIVQRVFELVLNNVLGRAVERLLGRWQAKRIHQNEPHIIVTKDELSFHPESKQDALLQSFL